MIAGEDLYGWGVCSLPMPRKTGNGRHRSLPPGNPAADLAGHLAHDIAWRTLAFSVVMTCLALAGIFLVEHRLPAQLSRQEAAPVEVTVRLREEVREIPPAAVSVPQEPPPAMELKEPPRRREPLPPPPEKPAPRTVARTAPPAPPQIKRPPAEEAPLPPPAPMSLPQRPAAPAPEIARQKTEVALEPAAKLPDPALSRYRQGPKPDAAEPLPARDPAFNRRTADAIPTVRPDLRPPAQRQAAPERLAAAPVTLGDQVPSGLQAVDTGLSRRKYETPSAAPALPSPVRRENLAAIGTSRDELQPPASLAPPRGAAPTLAPPPTADRVTAFGVHSAAEVEPVRPVANLAKPTATAAPNRLSAAGASFDFLDQVAPADLDRSFLVSLNRLRTCLDPSAEIKLKTLLATLLSRPAVCRSGGVLFDIRYPESAYSIQLDIYDYERKNFPDRCAALRQAVECCEARR